MKLYLNDVGLLTSILYGLNVNAVLQDLKSINLGTVYELVVAQELAAHNFKLHYYDNKQNGEVDFLIDDYNLLKVMPVEIKSGKDYTVHSALSRFLNTPEYGIGRAYVFSNERKVYKKGSIVYLPIYYCIFLQNEQINDDVILPELETVGNLPSYPIGFEEEVMVYPRKLSHSSIVINTGTQSKSCSFLRSLG